MFNEPHFTVQSIAELWGLSQQAITKLFADEPGVLKMQQPGVFKRRYVTLRIPESVVQRVHNRMVTV